MNPFAKLMEDIFNNQDFLEECVINGNQYKCIASSIADDVSYVETGMESEQNFTIDIKLPVFPVPKSNDKVLFRDKQYKVSDLTTDSANKSIKIHLIALSKGK